ncbi:hypothetical protein AWZ03_006475 [Drosophila navojoa]|uniref:Uncharacterized protein n=1 Tax=Drosophila navojoa TaxID=7232 RepID=A0A484BE84_DRONA|nr:hypothetical protein AWZ03_006475 [Drosophila navojoa]
MGNQRSTSCAEAWRMAQNGHQKADKDEPKAVAEPTVVDKRPNQQEQQQQQEQEQEPEQQQQQLWLRADNECQIELTKRPDRQQFAAVDISISTITIVIYYISDLDAVSILLGCVCGCVSFLASGPESCCGSGVRAA